MTAPARAELVAIDGGYEILVTDVETGAVTRRRIGILSVAMLAEQSARALAAHVRAVQSPVQIGAVSAPSVQSREADET